MQYRLLTVYQLSGLIFAGLSRFSQSSIFQIALGCSESQSRDNMAEGQQPGGQTQKVSDIITSFRPTKVGTRMVQFSRLITRLMVVL